jgi:hypothetical protein
VSRGLEERNNRKKKTHVANSKEWAGERVAWKVGVGRQGREGGWRRHKRDLKAGSGVVLVLGDAGPPAPHGWQLHLLPFRIPDLGLRDLRFGFRG